MLTENRNEVVRHELGIGLFGELMKVCVKRLMNMHISTILY